MGAESLFEVGGVKLYPTIEPTCPPDKPIQGNYIAAKIWNNYGGEIGKQAEAHDIPVAAALAVFMTEAGGEAYDPATGLLIIQCEEWYFEKLTGSHMANAYMRQPREWKSFRKAYLINPTAALMSTSWGLAQVMGFNHEIVGYPGPAQMVTAFQYSAAAQVKAFFDFCTANRTNKYIRAQDWPSFVRVYNGRGQVPHYTKVLKNNLMAAKAALNVLP